MIDPPEEDAFLTKMAKRAADRIKPGMPKRGLSEARLAVSQTVGSASEALNNRVHFLAGPDKELVAETKPSLVSKMVRSASEDARAAAERRLAMENLEMKSRIKGAMAIQQAYRRLKFMYLSFGPMIFCRKEGEPADFGRISFVGSAPEDASNFITISDSTRVELIGHFLAFYWKACAPHAPWRRRASARSKLLVMRVTPPRGTRDRPFGHMAPEHAQTPARSWCDLRCSYR